MYPSHRSENPGGSWGQRPQQLIALRQGVIATLAQHRTIGKPSKAIGAGVSWPAKLGITNVGGIGPVVRFVAANHILLSESLRLSATLPASAGRSVFAVPPAHASGDLLPPSAAALLPTAALLPFAVALPVFDAALLQSVAPLPVASSGGNSCLRTNWKWSGNN